MATNAEANQLAHLARLEAQLDQLLAEAVGTLRTLPQLQEPGWRMLGSESNRELIAEEIDRQTQNQLARWYHHQDPTASQAVMLHNAYTFARGISPKAKDERVQRVIDAFWKDTRNQHSLTRAAAQWALNTERQLEGELFFGLFVSTLTGRVTVRLFEPSEFPEHNGIVTMPGDPTFPVYYRREYAPRWFDFKEGAYKTGQRLLNYYPDFRNAAADLTASNGHGKWVQWEPNTEVYVMHVCTNPLGGRGLTHLNPGIPWVKALKGFMEDRATLTLAQATFAFVQKVKGNIQKVRRMRDQWGRYETEQRYGPAGDPRERRQAGQTFIGNEAVELEQFKTDSGASQAYQDMRMFRQMALIGLGHIFEHYGGDPSTGNLATATAMELPMLKLFEFEQQVWEDVVGDLLNFVVLMGLRHGPPDVKALAAVSVDMAGGSPLWVVTPKGGADLTVSATLPQIVQADVGMWANALASIASAEVSTGQQMVPPEQKAITMLNMLGVDDIGTIVEEMKKNGFQIATPPSDMQRDDQDETPPGDGQDEDESDDEVEERLVTAVRERYRALKKLRAAQNGDADEDPDPPPDLGDPLPDAEAEAVEPFTRSELDLYFDYFEALPDLDEFLDQLGLSIEDVE